MKKMIWIVTCLIVFYSCSQFDNLKFGGDKDEHGSFATKETEENKTNPKNENGKDDLTQAAFIINGAFEKDNPEFTYILYFGKEGSKDYPKRIRCSIYDARQPEVRDLNLFVKFLRNPEWKNKNEKELREMEISCLAHIDKGLGNVVVLNLMKCGINGRGLKQLSKVGFQNLEYLYLGQNQICSEELAYIAKSEWSSNLKSLDLSDNEISLVESRKPQRWFNFKSNKVQIIDLRKNPLSRNVILSQLKMLNFREDASKRSVFVYILFGTSGKGLRYSYRYYIEPLKDAVVMNTDKSLSRSQLISMYNLVEMHNRANFKDRAPMHQQDLRYGGLYYI